MFGYKAKLFYADSEETKNADAFEKDLGDGVKAVFVDGVGDAPLNSRNAVFCSIMPEKTPVSYMALDKNQFYWCEPHFGDDLSQIPDDTQLLLMLNSDNTYTVILPAVTEDYKCVIKGCENGFGARLFSLVKDLCVCRCMAFVYMTTNDPFTAVHTLFKKAFEELGTGIKLIEEKKYPEMFEYLGWCTWDAFNIKVNEEGVLEKCREFKEKNIPVRWAILDDMWADIPKFRGAVYDNSKERHKLMQSSGISSFEACPDRFPDGLRHCIDEMKKYLTWVGMWHPINGYWFGIEKDSKLFEEYKDILYNGFHDGRYNPYPDYKSFSRFFNGFHSFLKECGADFVKVDNQSISELYYSNVRPVGKMAKELHKALEECTDKYFDGALINCMGCSNEDLWTRPESSVSRCSNDFLPENVPWFKRHIMQCTFMSLLQGPLYVNDYDMWWTDDSQGRKNSLLRSISGGPIYVSDKLGRSRRELLMPLCFDDGRILRCSRSGMPTKDCLMTNPENSGVAFKVQNILGSSGAVAAFSLDSECRSVKCNISPSDVEGLCGDEFAVYEHFAHKFYTMKKSDSMEVELSSPDDFRLYIFVPIIDGFAAIGRTDKYMSPIAVKEVKNGNVVLYEDGPSAYYKDGKFYETK